MKSPASLIYTGLGMVFLVILPFFLIASAHLKKHLPGNDCIVTNISGKACVQYQVEHILNKKAKTGKRYCKKSCWVPLQKGSNVAFGALIKTEKKSFVDIMVKNVAALRINEQSLIKLDRIAGNFPIIDLALSQGKVLSRVIAQKTAPSQKRSDWYQVRTPTATARVLGTIFAVNYLPFAKMTGLAVLDGTVYIKPNNPSALETRVHRGQKTRISPSGRRPRLENINPALRKELCEVQHLKCKETGLDRWNQTMDLVVASPLYNKALNIITNYELKVFKRTIIYYARLIWGNTVPDRLQAVELEEGDYQDPWNTDYLYEKLESKNAVLISAGPDKIFHTQDDLFVSINL